MEERRETTLQNLDVKEINVTNQMSFNSTIEQKHRYSETISEVGASIESSESTGLVITALPLVSPDKVKGKTIAKWAIDRRRVSKSLEEYWEKAFKKKDNPSFCVYVDSIIEIIENNISEFRNIPYEDTFSGILQLLKNALSGKNVVKIQDDNLCDFFNDIFKELVSIDRLSLSYY